MTRIPRKMAETRKGDEEQMKKWLIASIAVSMLLFSAVPAGAEPVKPEPQQTEAGKSEKGWLQKAEFMEKYRKEWSQLNKLEKEGLELRINMLDQREELANLMFKAKKDGDITKIKPAAELHQMMKAIHKEKKEVQKEYKEQRKMMFEAMKMKDEKKMKETLHKMIELKQQKNNIAKKKVDETNKFIKQLSKK